MSNKNLNTNPNQSPYYNKMHRLGKFITLGSMAVFFGVPLIMCLVYGVMPKFSEIMLASGGIVAIFLPMGVAEVIGEVPVMGTSYYIASTTGNILNLKLPAALNAQKVANVKAGTEEADAVTGIAVAVSSLVTIVLLAAGLLLLTPLKPLLGSEVVSTAASYVLPALFGCMVLGNFSRDVGGGVKIYGRMKANIIPIIIGLVLYFFIMPESYESWEGVIAVVFIPIIYFSCKYLYKKGKITVEMPGDNGAKEIETAEEGAE
ncbi:MAG: hypothetical protein ACI4LA_05755 [Emergencia sp.]